MAKRKRLYKYHENSLRGLEIENKKQIETEDWEQLGLLQKSSNTFMLMASTKEKKFKKKERIIPITEWWVYEINVIY